MSRQAEAVPARLPARQSDRDAAIERERKLVFVAVALMGVREAAAWIRDEDLNRATGRALGRTLDLLREVRTITEADE